MKRAFVMAALLSLGAFHGAVAGEGVNGASSLKLGMGARGQSMGDAAAVSANGVESLFWNPAGLAAGAPRSILFGFQPLLEDSSMGQVAAAGKIGKVSLGLGFSNIDHGSFDEIDDVGNRSGEFDAQDQLLIAGLAIGGARRSLGISGKFFRSDIDGVSASAAMLDVGLNTGSFFGRRFRHAFAVRHLGGKISYLSQEDPLPTTAVLGTAYTSGKRLLVETDINFERDLGTYVSAGVEYGVMRRELVQMDLRAGYSTRRNEAEKLSGASAGLGIAIGSVSLDYAWVPFGELGDAHSVSMVWRPSTEPPRSRDTAPKGRKQTLKSTKDKIAPSSKNRKQLDDLDPPAQKIKILPPTPFFAPSKTRFWPAAAFSRPGTRRSGACFSNRSPAL